jgi:hypothetical protein
VAENALDNLLACAQFVKVGRDSASEAVPTVPRNTNSFDCGANDTLGELVRIQMLPIARVEDDARRWIPSTSGTHSELRWHDSSGCFFADSYDLRDPKTTARSPVPRRIVLAATGTISLLSVWELAVAPAILTPWLPRSGTVVTKDKAPNKSSTTPI